jgi:non-specific serine/threonine protein kinase
VWYVDLAPLQDPDRVALTVATTLGIREDGGQSTPDTIAAALGGKRLLIVLDNCEHLMAAAASLVRDLVSALPDLHVLAASREGLGVPGERAVTVRSLSFPPAGPTDPATLESSEAVRLFVERARLSVPRFALDVDNADAVAEICRRLDGIPLAIELAAARVRMLSVDEIRARLDDRFRLLTGGSRAAIGRQQTLLATIRWSYEHLAPAEQALLRRLSVFAGGWTLEGAVAVAGDGADEYVVLDRLARLVDQSLVSTRHVAGDATRYAMLETVRQYAQERLEDAGEGAAMRDRHLAYVVAFAERAAPELVRNDQFAWFARLDHERENLLAAHAWCDHATDGAALGLRLVFALLVYFRNRGLLALQLRMGVEALSRPGADAPTVARGHALLAAGEPAYFLGRYDEARRYVEASLAIGRELDDLETIASALRLQNYVALAQGDPVKALASIEASADAARRLGDDAQLASSLNGLAELHRSEGRLAEAKTYYEEGVALHRRNDDGGGCGVGAVNLAVTNVMLGDLDAARRWLAEGMALVNATDWRRTSIVLTDAATGFAAACGRFDLAAWLHGAAEAAAAEIGFRREPVDQAFVSPWVERARDALGGQAFDAALAAGRAMPFDEAFDEARRYVETGEAATLQIVSAALKD